MKWAHNITITVFAKPEEDIERIRQGLAALVPFDLEVHKITIREKRAQGFNERIIRIFSIKLTKQRHTREFLRFLLGQLSAKQKRQLTSQADSRTDEECDFYIRIDKDQWADQHRLQLTDSGHCYHLKLSLAAFPKKRENALTLVGQLLAQKDI